MPKILFSGRVLGILSCTWTNLRTLWLERRLRLSFYQACQAFITRQSAVPYRYKSSTRTTQAQSTMHLSGICTISITHQHPDGRGTIKYKAHATLAQLKYIRTCCTVPAGLKLTLTSDTDHDKCSGPRTAAGRTVTGVGIVYGDLGIGRGVCTRNGGRGTG